MQAENEINFDKLPVVFSPTKHLEVFLQFKSLQARKFHEKKSGCL